MGLIKTAVQQQRLRTAGQLLKKIYASLPSRVAPGAVPLTLDKQIEREIKDAGATPSFLHYQGYPHATCISVNEQVVHGIPQEIPLKEGDIVTVDIGLKYQSVFVDAARTYAVGTITEDARRLVQVTEEALAAGVAQAKPGQRVGAISHAIEQVANKAKLGIVRNYTGHGVGTAVHEEPTIPNYGSPHDGPVLKPGMVLAIEPMFTLGGGEVLTLSDGWTVITNDATLAAQVEHTVLITEQGHEIIV